MRLETRISKPWHVGERLHRLQRLPACIDVPLAQAALVDMALRRIVKGYLRVRFTEPVKLPYLALPQRDSYHVIDAPTRLAELEINSDRYFTNVTVWLRIAFKDKPGASDWHSVGVSGYENFWLLVSSLALVATAEAAEAVMAGKISVDVGGSTDRGKVEEMLDTIALIALEEARSPIDVKLTPASSKVTYIVGVEGETLEAVGVTYEKDRDVELVYYASGGESRRFVVDLHTILKALGPAWVERLVGLAEKRVPLMARAHAARISKTMLGVYTYAKES